MKKNADEFIFSQLLSLKENITYDFIKSLSIEIKLIEKCSRYYLSVLLNNNDLIDDACDEIVFSVESSDRVCFKMELSDSLGKVYTEHVFSELTDMEVFINTVPVSILKIACQLIKK